MEKFIYIIIFLIISFVIYRFYSKIINEHINCFCITLKITVIMGILSFIYLLFHIKYECHKNHKNHKNHNNVIFDGQQSVWILTILISVLMLFSYKLYHVISA
jgi:heme/copper-type cytochrome/quinol oxidase subunit 2